MNVKTIKFDEIPKGKNQFHVLRASMEPKVILEEYVLGENGWDNELLEEFDLYEAFNKNELLKKIHRMFPEIKTLYVEENTFRED